MTWQRTLPQIGEPTLRQLNANAKSSFQTHNLGSSISGIKQQSNPAYWPLSIRTADPRQINNMRAAKVGGQPFERLYTYAKSIRAHFRNLTTC